MLKDDAERLRGRANHTIPRGGNGSLQFTFVYAPPNKRRDRFRANVFGVSGTGFQTTMLAVAMWPSLAHECPLYLSSYAVYHVWSALIQTPPARPQLTRSKPVSNRKFHCVRRDLALCLGCPEWTFAGKIRWQPAARGMPIMTPWAHEP
jgi:hypothetical protein